MIERWSRDQVLALAPDTASQKAASGVAAPAKWPVRGAAGTVVYGECKGSGKTPYLACVDLGEPAYRCSCPSRKFPCKHALGLLLMWSADEVPEIEAAPQWVTEWVETRAERAARAAARVEAARAAAAGPIGPADAFEPGSGAAADSESVRATNLESVQATDLESVRAVAPESVGASDAGSARAPGAGAAGGTSEAASGGASEAASGAESGPAPGVAPAPAQAGESVRHGRVAAGLSELERWLADQVRQGLAGTAAHDWDDLAKRLVDAQAPGVASMVSRLAAVRAEDDWPERLLTEYALINLLAVAYRRRAELPAPLARTVLSRVGFPVTKEEVLAGPAVRDHWDVLGRRDEPYDRLTARRVWLRGRRTGRPALILSFAPQGQSLDASLVTGTTIDADLAFYPGAAPLRAVVATCRAIVSAPDLITTGRQAAQPDAPPLLPNEASPPVPPGASPAVPPEVSAPVPPGGSSAVRPAVSPPVSPGGSPAVPPEMSAPVPPGGSPAVRPAVSGSVSSAMSPAVPPGVSPGEAMEEVGRAVAADPWTDSWPLVLAGVVPDRDSLGGLPLHPRARDPWRLIAVSGGRPLTVAAEWTPQGLRPLTTWDDEGLAVIL